MKEKGWRVNKENPKKIKKYRVKTVEGSMIAKIAERILIGRLYPTGFRFATSDWQYVTHWMELKSGENP